MLHVKNQRIERGLYETAESETVKNAVKNIMPKQNSKDFVVGNVHKFIRKSIEKSMYGKEWSQRNNIDALFVKRFL